MDAPADVSAVKIYVETAQTPPAYAAAESFSVGDAAKHGLVEFDKALDGIKALAIRVGDALVDVGPSKFTLECDLTVGGEGGVIFIGKAEAQATFKVTMEWDREETGKRQR